ncbi:MULTISPECIES: chaplin [Streptomyces]|uniref:Chaplin n=1 Tax=Streptomyces eurythermus TaxID=42237 RepID=A0ABW6YPL7_9ACTN|nr:MULTISPECIES: chaplin [Streptomyces]QIS74787.1 chaplin [Streptomyces sp. DSM 40868]WDM10819.1 chaplin [Streptomyces lavenduligriseus]
MRLRSLATTTVITAALALAGTANAFASDGGGGGGASAVGVAANSPGILSGNVVQVPINLQANVCGNTINIIGLLNPAVGNICVNK